MRSNNTYNMAIRKAMQKHNLFLYELADILGISEPTLCRWMRKELPTDEQNRIISLIENHDKSSGI